MLAPVRMQRSGAVDLTIVLTVRTPGKAVVKAGREPARRAGERSCHVGAVRAAEACCLAIGAFEG
jgi:hypothetical protein